MCSGEDEIAKVLNCDNSTLTDEQNKRNHGYFDRIKGISAQALDDFKSLKIEHCSILYPLADFVSRTLKHQYHGCTMHIFLTHDTPVRGGSSTFRFRLIFSIISTFPS